METALQYSIDMSRPSDVFHPDFEQGLPTYFDLTVQNPLQRSCVVQVVACMGITAEAGESEKDTGHVLVSASGSVSILLFWCLCSISILLFWCPWVCGQLTASRS